MKVLRGVLVAIFAFVAGAYFCEPLKDVWTSSTADRTIDRVYIEVFNEKASGHVFLRVEGRNKTIFHGLGDIKLRYYLRNIPREPLIMEVELNKAPRCHGKLLRFDPSALSDKANEVRIIVNIDTCGVFAEDLTNEALK